MKWEGECGKKWLHITPLSACLLLQCDITGPPIKKWTLYRHSLYLGWPCGLLWLPGYSQILAETWKALAHQGLLSCYSWNPWLPCKFRPFCWIEIQSHLLSTPSQLPAMWSVVLFKSAVFSLGFCLDFLSIIVSGGIEVPYYYFLLSISPSRSVFYI